MFTKSWRIPHHSTVNKVVSLSLILVACWCLFGFAPPVRAEVTWSGDVVPDDPTTWDSDTWGHIGSTAIGSLNITNGSGVLDKYGYVGRYAGSTGAVTVDGPGSTWTNGYNLYLGNYGSGTLNIKNDAAVTVGQDTWLSRYLGSGTINFEYGILTTGSLCGAVEDLTGTGTINARGLVSDLDLVFDATHGLNQTFNLNDDPGRNITVNLNIDGSSLMGAGFSGVGTMSISEGTVVESTKGYIGYKTGSSGEVTVEGTGSTWTNSSKLYVGDKGSGTLNITGGGAVNSEDGYIGSNSGSTGAVTVEGPGSTWTNSGDLYVGDEENGTLSITNGGMVSNNTGYMGYGVGSTGAVTVEGLGSTWTNSGNLYVGSYYDCLCTLNITAGGAVSSYEAYIGKDNGSIGAVTVEGPGSTWTNTSDLYVGKFHNSSGALNITGGGAVSNKGCYIGYNFGSTGAVTVDGPGSTWTNDWDLYVGYSGSGTLNIANGGAVSSDEAYLGYKPGATGTVTVEGPGSTWTNIRDDEYLYIGYEGSGTLNVTNGGAVCSETCKIGLESGSTGQVTVAGPGSTWTNSSELFVGNKGSGTIDITGGGAVCNNGYASIGSKGEVTVAGPGSTWTSGDYLYAYGTLNITNGGRVTVAGTLTTYGNGFINLAGGGMLALYGAADESLFDFLGLIDGGDAIRYWDDSISDWADITGATYGRDYTLTYLTAGDLAGYTMLTVPEPTALSLLVLGAVAMFRHRDRRGKLGPV